MDQDPGDKRIDDAYLKLARAFEVPIQRTPWREHLRTLPKQIWGDLRSDFARLAQVRWLRAIAIAIGVTALLFAVLIALR